MRMQLIDHQTRLQLPASWPNALRPEALNRMDHPTPFLVCDLDTVRERYTQLAAALPGVRCFYAVKCNPELELNRRAQPAPGPAVSVRLRVDDSTSLFPLSRKFGAEAQEARALLLLARSLGLRPYGVTFHVGSQCTTTTAWRQAIAPGRYLVAESAVLVGGVLGREVRAGENWAYLDVGAYNGLMETQQTVNQWRYPLWSSRPDHGAADQVPFTVTGPSCDSSDTTFFGVYLPATLDAEDRLYIGSAGAYTLSYASS